MTWSPAVQVVGGVLWMHGLQRANLQNSNANPLNDRVLTHTHTRLVNESEF